MTVGVKCKVKMVYLVLVAELAIFMQHIYSVYPVLQGCICVVCKFYLFYFFYPDKQYNIGKNVFFLSKTWTI